MNKKEYLSQAFVLNRRIELKEKRIDALRASIGCTSSNPDEVRVKSEPHSTFETMLMIVLDLENEVKKEKEELEKLKMEIWKAIHAIGDDSVEGVLVLRYIGFKNWDEIAASYGHSLDYVYRQHRRGMDMLRACNL